VQHAAQERIAIPPKFEPPPPHAMITSGSSPAISIWAIDSMPITSGAAHVDEHRPSE